MSEWNRKPPDEEEIARALRELPGVEADPAFRARLRGEFVEGRIEGTAPSASLARGGRRGARWSWAVPALVAAAAVLVIALNRGPALRVLGAGGAGDLVVDAVADPLSDRAAWAPRVRPGASIETPDGATVDILVDGVVLYEIAGGTRMTIPDSPGRWFNSAVECSLFAGELRVKTGPRFPGATLRVHTPDGLTVVTGTLISVQCSAGGTCVCVLEGVARVGVDEGDLEAVRPGYRKVMMRDGAVEIIPIEPTHRADLIDFDARVGRTVEYP